MKFILFLLVITNGLFSQTIKFGAEAEIHLNSVKSGKSSYDALPSIEYSIFMMSDLTYNMQWRIRISTGEKVAREEATDKGNYYDWRFFYYSITPEIQYEIIPSYYVIGGFSLSFTSNGSWVIVSEGQDVRVAVDINKKNLNQELNPLLKRVHIGFVKNFYFKSLLISPKLLYYHGFDNALKSNDDYDFTFSSFSFNLGVAF